MLYVYRLRLSFCKDLNTIVSRHRVHKWQAPSGSNNVFLHYRGFEFYITIGDLIVQHEGVEEKNQKIEEVRKLRKVGKQDLFKLHSAEQKKEKWKKAGKNKLFSSRPKSSKNRSKQSINLDFAAIKRKIYGVFDALALFTTIWMCVEKEKLELPGFLTFDEIISTRKSSNKNHTVQKLL